MAGSVFGFDAAGPMDGFGAVKPATEDPKARFDRLAGQYQVPANLLIALTEAGGDVGKADAIAADIGARVKLGKTLDMAVSELAGSPEKSAALMSRAYDIADMLYPRQVEAEKPVEPSMPRDLAAGAGGAVVSGAGLGVDYVGSAMGRAMGVPDENTTLGEYIGSKLKGAGQKISSYVSPETQRLRDATLPKGDVTDPSTWQAPEDVNLRGVMQAMAEGLGSMAPVVVTALATRGSSLAAAGVGGAMAGGDGRDTAAQIIDQKWQERGDDGKSSLERESDVYRALISEGKTPNQAYIEVRNRAMNAAGDYQAVVGGVGGAVTGGIVSKGLPASLAGKSAIANAGRGVAVSAVEEGVQEAGETAAARTGVNQASNLGLNVTEGTVEAAAAGALAGGPVGGLAGMSGAQGEPQPAPGPKPDPLQITGQSKRLALPAPESKTLALPAPPKPPGTGFVMVDGEAQASPADGSGGGDVAASGGEVNMPASPGAAIDPIPKPTGILSQAAAVAPDLRPIPEAPAPESLFPDHKPGNALRLQTPDGSIIDATYLREGPNGVTLRVGGNTFDISPQEFDQAVNGARAADLAAKEAKSSKGATKAAQPAPAPIAETKPASPVAAPEAPVSAPLAQQAVAAVRQPEAVSPEMPAMTPEKAMEMIKTIEETAKRGGWTKRLIAKKEELSRIAAPAMQQPGGADDKGNSGAAPLAMDGLENGGQPSATVGDDNAGSGFQGQESNPQGATGGFGDPQERPAGPGLRSNMDDAGQTGVPDNQLSEPTTDFLGVQATKADLEQFVAQRSALVAERKQAMKSAKKEGKAELIKKNAETNKLIEEAKQALAGKFEAKTAPESASQPAEAPGAETGTEPVTAEQAMAKASVRTLSSDEVARVGFDAKAFQYKANGDESGVTERLQGVAEWDEASAMGGMVYEFADGRMVVADGHQRLGLARRLQEQGKLTPWTVSVFREADGFTPAQIRMIAALKNIREGSGTAIDAAKVMRDAGGDAASLNLPPKSALVRDAKGLAMLSQDAFGMVVNEVSPVMHGAVVGRLVKNPAMHQSVLGLLKKLAPANQRQAELIAEQAAQEEVTETQTSLFGDEDVAQNLYLERAKILDAALSRIRQDRATFKVLADRAGTIVEEGNVLNKEANAARAENDAKVQAYLGAEADRKGPISEALTAAAKRLKAEPKTIGRIVGDFLKAIESKPEGIGADGGNDGGAGRQDAGGSEGLTEAEPIDDGPGLFDAPITTEKIPEGIQTVIPGTERMSAADAKAAVTRDKAKAEIEARQRQSKMGRLNGNDGDSGPLFNDQTDMFGSAPSASEVKAAAATADRNPTEAQKEAGNYSMGHILWNGLDLTIETAKGAMRRGKDSDGETWSVKMPAHYGYIKSTTGADGDHVDFYMGDNPESDVVVIVDQVDAETRAFDEHKVMLGFANRKTALDFYVQGFSDGKGADRMGAHKVMTVSEFKEWLANGDTTKPVRLDAKVEAPKPTTKIADFGEKIGGAKKDRWSGYKDKMAEAEGVDVAAEPLSKSWPEPDYGKLIEDGVDSWTVGFIRAAREYVPRKPSVKWKVKQWAVQVELLRKFASDIMSGAIDPERLKQKLALQERLNAKISGKIALYEAVGHAKSLRDLTFEANKYSVLGGVYFDQAKVFWEVTKDQAATVFSNMPRVMVRADTKEDALAKFKEAYASLDSDGQEKGSRSKGTKFLIYSMRKEKAVTYRIGVKIGKNYIDLRTGIEDVKEARRIVAEEADQLQAKLDKIKEIPNERRDENSPRIGADHRNGTDVTPEMFSNAFGFRGVEFGNWVEDSRRQEDLNNAFDAMMDLASILDLPPKAMSLNGSLGLAFGARGSGGKNPAAAHFEPGKIVINLTKRSGRGSLAHEWFHAMDNHFARKRTTPRGTYFTDNSSPGGPLTEGIRPEVVNYFIAVKRAILGTELKTRSANLDKTRSTPYWGTGIEMHARAFESYVIAKLQDQSASNDYLANVVNGTVWGMMAELSGAGDSYPYLKDGEIEVVRPAFDKLFQTIETRETDSGVEMFSRIAPDGAAQSPIRLRDLNVAVREELDRIGLTGRVAVRVASTMGKAGVFGRYSAGEITINDGPGALAVLDHEIIHAMRDMGEGGLFTKDEWQGLVRAARADKELMARVESAYADLSTIGQMEEAVAELYRGWASGNRQLGAGAKAFAKVKAFFEALGNVLIGRGFQSAGKTMQDIASGKIGVRDGGFAESALVSDYRNTSSPEFAKWFGKSKVVDSDGKPLVVYHGTKADFGEFDPDFKISSNGFWFGSAEMAGTFALAKRGFAPTEGANVMPVYLSIQNPLVHSPINYFGLSADEILSLAKKSGNDGVEFTSQKTGEKTWVAFAPTQIKSVFNRGKWDGANPNILDFRADLLTDKFKGMLGNKHWRKPDAAFFSSLLTDAMAGKNGYDLLSMVPGRALFTELGKNLLSARAYQRGKEKMDTLRQDWHARADVAAQEWRKLRNKHPRDNDAFMDLMHRTTLAGIDPSKDDTWRHAMHEPALREVSKNGDKAADWAKGVVKQIEAHKRAYRTLHEKFAALPPAFQAMYSKLRAEYDKLGDDFEAAVIENIENATRIGLKRAEKAYQVEMQRIKDEGLKGSERDDAIAVAESAVQSARKRGGWGAKARIGLLRASFESNRLKGPYFPLARFGDYFVTIRDADGKVISFSRFEREADQKREVARAEQLHPGRVKFGVISKAEEIGRAHV